MMIKAQEEAGFKVNDDQLKDQPSNLDKIFGIGKYVEKAVDAEKFHC